MALQLRIVETTKEALRLLKEQGLDIEPYIADISDTADELARLSLTAMKTDLAKRALRIAKSGTVLSSEQAIRQAFDEYKTQAKAAFDTNLRIAYSAGRYERAKDAKRMPLFVLRTMRDRRVRPTHRRLEGVALPKDDKFWATHWPPMGYRCRCKAYAVSQDDLDELKRAGVAVQPKAPREATVTYINKYTGKKEKVPESIDPGWLIAGEAPARNPMQALQVVVDRKNAELVAEYTGSPVKYPTEPAPAPKAPKQPQLPLAPAEPPAAPTPPSVDTTGWAYTDYIKAGKAFREQHIPAFDALSTDAQVASAYQKWLSAYQDAVPDRAFNGAGMVEPPGAPAAKKSARAKAIAAADKAVSVFPASWVEASKALGKVNVYVGDGIRAKYSHVPYAGTFSVGRGTMTLNRGDGIIYLSATDKNSTIVHEFSHRIQAALPALDAFFQEWAKQRSKGERLQSLRALTGLNYRASEMAYPDNFYDPYIGKRYAGLDFAEAMAMGLDAMLPLAPGMATSPVELKHFRKVLTTDPEMADLVIGLLLYWRP